MGTGTLTVRDEISGMSGGRISTKDTHIGYIDTGRFVHSVGTHEIQEDLFLGNGAVGTYELSDGSLSAEREFIGYHGTGHMSQSGGTNIVRGYVYLAFSDTIGTYELGGNGELVADKLIVGHQGDAFGQFTQIGATDVVVNDLFIGNCHRSTNGIYVLSDTAQLSTNCTYVGYGGMGTFTQTGGSHTVIDKLRLGRWWRNEGTYELIAGDLTAGTEEIGYNNRGIFVQSGGTNTVLGDFILGVKVHLDWGYRGYGTYQLSGTGQLSAIREYIGNWGDGTFTQSGGTNTVGQNLYMGYESGSEGTYELGGTGQLSADNQYIGYDGAGTFAQSGGTNTVQDKLSIGYIAGSAGAYELSGTGQLSAVNENVGYFGTGALTQSGGTNTVSQNLYVGHQSGSEGTYELSGTGQLSAFCECIGYYGVGRFTQTGGTNDAGMILNLGMFAGSSGTYELGGDGRLSVCYMFVGFHGEGTLDINSPSAEMVVSNKLCFGVNSTFLAVPDATIHMTGSAFENQSTNPDNLAGLANLTLIFEGGSSVVDPFEVAGEDMGAVFAGLEGNFALGTLQLGGADIGQLQLVNLFDNQPGWEGSEALYVENLLLDAGSTLDLNGLNLYYLNGTIDGLIIDSVGSGSAQQIPEPASAVLLLSGSVLVMFRRRKK